VENEEGRDGAEWFADGQAAIGTSPEVSAVVVPSGKNGFDVGTVLPVDRIILVMGDRDNCDPPQRFRQFGPVLARNWPRCHLAGIAGIDGERQCPALA
jgi:hypothetical protein